MARDDISRALGLLDAISGIRPHLGYSIEGVIVAAKEAREILERARSELDRQGRLLAEAERLCMEHCPEEMSAELLADWEIHQEPESPNAGVEGRGQ